MKILRTPLPGIACAAICLWVDSASQGHPAYRVELDVTVTDEQALCRHAWNVALPDHGPAITEMMTMPDGKFDVQRCLATVYQKLPVTGAESRVIYVRPGQ